MCYTICGAIAFQALETTDETDDLIEKVEDNEKAVTDNLNTRWLPGGLLQCQSCGTSPTLSTLLIWGKDREKSLISPSAVSRLWRNRTHETVSSYQTDLVQLVQAGYDGHTVAERWTFPAALMFTLSVITTIGLVRGFWLVMACKLSCLEPCTECSFFVLISFHLLTLNSQLLVH